jgi:four helix bundle protein
MKTYSFERLVVWQCSRRLAKNVYSLTGTFPPEEKFGIISQMRRAAISVWSNLAEGSSRHSGKEKAKYTRIAFGSLMELLSQCIICSDLEFICDNDMKLLRDQIDEVAVKSTGLRDAQLKLLSRGIAISPFPRLNT